MMESHHLALLKEEIHFSYFYKMVALHHMMAFHNIMGFHCGSPSYYRRVLEQIQQVAPSSWQLQLGGICLSLHVVVEDDSIETLKEASKRQEKTDTAIVYDEEDSDEEDDMNDDDEEEEEDDGRTGTKSVELEPNDS